MKRYPITPMGAPRMTRADAWKDRACVLRYRAFKDECRLRKVEIPATPFIVFNIPMPASWSKKTRARMNGTPHMSKPDIDNLQKALYDAVHPDDDSHIWGVQALKFWAEEGSILIGKLDQTVLMMMGVRNDDAT